MSSVRCDTPRRARTPRHEKGVAVGVPGSRLDRRRLVQTPRGVLRDSGHGDASTVSGRYIVEEFVKGIGLDDGYEKFDKAVHERTGFHLSEQSPLDHVKAVTVPTLVAQVHDDTMTRPEDVQEIYDAIPVAEKSLYWIEGTDRRFDGYNFFGVHPELPIEWFDKHIN
jgi:hypothetical protein